jgi:hypothetical protein
VGEIAGALRRRSWIVGGLFTGVGEHLRHADAGRGSEHEGTGATGAGTDLERDAAGVHCVTTKKRHTRCASDGDHRGLSRARDPPILPHLGGHSRWPPFPHQQKLSDAYRRTLSHLPPPGTAVATTHVHVERDSVPRAPAKSHSTRMLSVATCADFVVTMSLSPRSAQVKKCSARRWRVTTTLRQGPRRRGRQRATGEGRSEDRMPSAECNRLILGLAGAPPMASLARVRYHRHGRRATAASALYMGFC